MLEPLQETPKQNEFSAIPGNLGAFMNNIQTPHGEDAELEFENTSAEEDIQFDTVSEEDTPTVEIPSAATIRLGKSLAKGCDKLVSGVYSMYSHMPAERYALGDDELTELGDAFTEYLKEIGAQISPGQALISAIIGCFATQIPTVIADRKAYEEQKSKPNGVITDSK